jgi:hypothetical protein
MYETLLHFRGSSLNKSTITMSSQPPPGLFFGSRISVLPRNSYRNCGYSLLKHLRYFGWCVLGVIGVLTDEQGNEIALNDSDESLVYHYIPGQNFLAHFESKGVLAGVEDGVMLFFGGNPKAALKRHSQKKQERTV